MSVRALLRPLAQGLTSHPSRELLQTTGDPQQSACELPRSTRRRLYDASTGTWSLDSEFLREAENNVQLLVDCMAESETLSLSRDFVLNSTMTLMIRRSLHITGEGSEGEAPTWTCGSSQDGNQIAVIR